MRKSKKKGQRSLILEEEEHPWTVPDSSLKSETARALERAIKRREMMRLGYYPVYGKSGSFSRGNNE
jgi:hypothetical protein